MRIFSLRFVVSLCFVFAACLTASADKTPVNLAKMATVTSSFTADFSNLYAVNDGRIYKPKKAKTEQYYCNWHGAENYGEDNWVMYELPFTAQFTTSMVYWYYCDSVSVPGTSSLEYWDAANEKWQLFGAVDTIADKYNTNDSLFFTTDKVRLNMKGAMATGIIEWQMYGYQICDTSIVITPYVKSGDGAFENVSYISVDKGTTVTFFADATTHDYEDKSWIWKGANGFSAEGQTLTLENVTADNTGSYTVTYTNVCGDIFSQTFCLNVANLAKGALYDWPVYDPICHYDFRDEFPSLEPPTKVLDDDSHVVGVIAKGWWCFRWGKNRRNEVTDVAINNLLDRMNTDFSYFRDVMGWPPDYRIQNGYYSTVDLFGSGLNDGADSTALGGWQSANWYNGASWPNVLISYLPVASFDPASEFYKEEFQRGAVVHEGIHAVLASLPGCRDAAWFHEGGNCWLQQQYAAVTADSYTELGWLGTGSFVAPFMPIECYSGWLQDDSFGGPSAQGVNVYNDKGQQLCNWRNLLGGVQYSSVFPTCLAEIMGDHAIPWIWRYCTERVLEGMSAQLGERQTRHLIQEYRARQATYDYGKWSSACRKVTDVGFNANMGSEYEPYVTKVKNFKGSPYAITTDDGTGWLTPEFRTTPGWSGANQIPLYAKGDTCSVIFLPLSQNMSCQLVYRSKTGYAYYSEPVACGECTLVMPEEPSNGIVIAVICNTDYIYEGEETRKKHHDYRLKMGKNITGKAATNVAWYNKWTLKNEKNPYVGGIPVIENEANGQITFKLKENVVAPGEEVYIDYDNYLEGVADVSLLSAGGKVCQTYTLNGRGKIAIPANISKGIYFVRFSANGVTQSEKLVVR